MAETKTTTETKPAVKKGFKRVIVRRPPGVTDSHQFFGFNDWGMQIKFDAEVELPEPFIDYLESAERVEYRADEKGQPVASYVAAYNILHVK